MVDRVQLPMLPIRVCSPHKTDKKRGFPCELYNEHMLKAFFTAFHDVKYALLSRKYGICFSWEQYDNYNDCDEKPDEEILTILTSQARDPIFNQYQYLYWNHRPLTHSKWVAMLRQAGFKVMEFRRIVEMGDCLLLEQ